MPAIGHTGLFDTAPSPSRSPEAGSAAVRSGANAKWPTALIARLAERVEREASAHPVMTDLGVVACVALAGVGGLASQNRLGAVQALFTAMLSLSLMLRRRQPLAVFLGIAAIASLQWLIADPQLGDAALLVALYGVALRGSFGELLAAGAILEAGSVMAALKWAPADPLKIWIGLSGLSVVPAVLGIAVRQRRALLASLHERAARLEFERDQEGRLAAAAERSRIAREMHDVVAHNLSVIVALADGVGYSIGSAPEQAALATEQISQTGRGALLDVRRLLGIFREEPGSGPLAPQPGIAELADMVEGVRAAGVPVTLDVDEQLPALGDGCQLAVFRVAQEALTNVLKHAGTPARASVTLSARGDRVELEVLNTGTASETPSTSGGGLRGMHERARAYGGQLEAGPTDAGDWRVHLRLPRSGAGG